MALSSDHKSSVMATEDENAGGRVDQRDDLIAADGAADDDAGVVTGDRDRDGPAVVGRAQVDEREAARRRLATPAPAGTVVDTTDTAPATVPEDTEVVAGPRPRGSLLATLSLVLGVAAALTVLTGVLAGPGVALGLIAAFVGIGGISATTRRHVAGKSDALLGMSLGLGAVVFGSLALTGTLPWLTADTDQVGRARDWLEAQLPWLFPS